MASFDGLDQSDLNADAEEINESLPTQASTEKCKETLVQPIQSGATETVVSYSLPPSATTTRMDRKKRGSIVSTTIITTTASSSYTRPPPLPTTDPTETSFSHASAVDAKENTHVYTHTPSQSRVDLRANISSHLDTTDKNQEDTPVRNDDDAAGSSRSNSNSALPLETHSFQRQPSETADNVYHEQESSSRHIYRQHSNMDIAASQAAKSYKVRLSTFWKSVAEFRRCKLRKMYEARKQRMLSYRRESVRMSTENTDTRVSRSPSFEGSLPSAPSFSGNHRQSIYAMTRNRNLPVEEMSKWEKIDEATILFPDSAMLSYWDTFMGLLIMYTAFMIPYVLGFNVSLDGAWKVLDTVVDFCFMLNIVVTTRIAVIDENMTITDAKGIIKHYAKTWLLFDILASLPLSLIFSNMLYVIPFRIPRLLRIARLVRLAKVNIWASTSNSYRVIRLSIQFTMVAHWVGCAWYFVSRQESFPDNGFSAPAHIDQLPVYSRYLRALSWGFTNLSGLGGNLIPQTDAECYLTLVVVIIALFVFATIIGSINSEIANLDRTQARFRERLQGVHDFMTYRRLPENTKVKIRHYYERIWFLNQGLDETDILGDLPRDLRMEVASHIHRKLLQKVPLFRDVEESFIRALSLRIRPEICLPGDYVFRFGEQASEMYFISSGCVEIISPDGSIRLAEMKEGAYFGEIAILSKTTRTASVRATEVCELFVLHKTDFDALLEQYPNVYAKIRQVARERSIERSRSLIMKAQSDASLLMKSAAQLNANTGSSSNLNQPQP